LLLHAHKKHLLFQYIYDIWRVQYVFVMVMVMRVLLLNSVMRKRLLLVRGTVIGKWRYTTATHRCNFKPQLINSKPVLILTPLIPYLHLSKIKAVFSIVCKIYYTMVMMTKHNIKQPSVLAVQNIWFSVDFLFI
jgi:hypothetical protein